jgi:hypothetical protein
MSPEEARKRAEAILRRQSHGSQTVELNSDGTLKDPMSRSTLKKSTILHDPLGEYA